MFDPFCFVLPHRDVCLLPSASLPEFLFPF